MLTLDAFANCIRENLKDKHYGKDRADEIIKDFDKRAKMHQQAGRSDSDAAILAMRETFDRIGEAGTERAKRTAKMLTVQAQNLARIKQGLTAQVTIRDNNKKIMGGEASRGEAVARAAVSLIEADPRFKGLSYASLRDVYRKQLFSIMGDVLDKVGKGAYGRQKGAVHFPNAVREIFGEKTEDKLAHDFAHAWLKVSDLGVDLFNQAGGSMRKLQRYIPQSRSIAKVVQNGGEDGADFVKFHMGATDWDRTRWPDLSVIDPADRPKVLKDIYDTYATDGATKIDATAFRGQGQAMGNLLDNNRFLHYKDATSWMQAHELYGDGNLFDVMSKHIDSMAHRTAMVDTFGPNPEATFANIKAMVKKTTAALSPQDKMAADAVLKNKFEPMMELVTRRNPMNPESWSGALTIGTSNILTAAQLGSSALLAIPGDFMQSVAVRAINHMDLFGGVGHYFKTLVTDREFMEKIAAQSGFVHDETVMSHYAATRFTGVATLGPSVTRTISDGVMRASLLAGHTRAGRWSAQAEFMGAMQRAAAQDFESLPFNRVMQRYGITPSDWDMFRNNVKAWQPRQDINFLRPIDILSSDLPKGTNAQTLYNKFQSMVMQESKNMVPESTIEATAALKGTSRPDTLMGVIMHSFAMYKNFPISFWHIYGRLGMTSPSVKGRLGFYAGLGAGMTMVGAMGVQMRELASGRDPMPMDNSAFLMKSFLAGGALSIWGDFLFSGLNRMGGGPTETAAGPLIGFMGDSAQLAFGEPFKWINAVGSLDKEGSSNEATKAVQYMQRYTPGSNLWWARLALQRQVWDRLQEMADPKVYNKRRVQQQQQMQQYGNQYWSPPGSRTYERLPQYREK